MIFLKNNWPLILISFYFIYKFYLNRSFKKLLPKLKAEGALFIDVRSRGEYESGHAPQTINIPLDQLNNEMSKLSRDKAIVVCCASGTRSAMAKGVLKKNGFRDVHNAGGWRALLT